MTSHVMQILGTICLCAALQQETDKRHQDLFILCQLLPCQLSCWEGISACYVYSSSGPTSVLMVTSAGLAASHITPACICFNMCTTSAQHILYCHDKVWYLQGTPSQQISSLWRGVGASLYKDVPFAGLFWTFLEPSRSWLNSHTHIPHSAAGIDMHTLAINALSGSLAGAAAAGITTPFDVAKTKVQTQCTTVERQSTVRCLVEVAQQSGIRGLFSGWGPRTLRTAAAYSILMSSYEICKGAYSQNPQSLH